MISVDSVSLADQVLFDLLCVWQDHWENFFFPL